MCVFVSQCQEFSSSAFVLLAGCHVSFEVIVVFVIVLLGVGDKRVEVT